MKMKTINMSAIDAKNLGKITEAQYKSYLKRFGPDEGRNYLVPVEVAEY